MSGTPAYHGWTHRPKGQGGTDPVPFEVSWCYARRSTNQLIDNNAEEVAWGEFYTNDTSLFALDTSGSSSGILVYGEGLFQTFGMAIVGVVDAATSRNTYVQSQPATVYPTFGTEFANPFAFDSSLLDDTNLRQVHMAFASMGGTPTAPYRTIIAAVRNGGVNYTITEASLSIIKIGGPGNL